MAKLFEGIKFYPVLRHVALPALTIIPRPVSLNRMGRPGSIKYNYFDQLFFFEWLQKEKYVKKIFKVIVEDADAPHRDEVIVDVLAGGGTRGPSKLQSFDVEILDWRKTDICPVVVQRSAPNVRELHLRWSGSNAVLRGWSEPEGLPKLNQLRQIHLQYHEVSNLLIPQDTILSHVPSGDPRVLFKVPNMPTEIGLFLDPISHSLFETNVGAM